jgi:hypothetical protein
MAREVELQGAVVEQADEIPVDQFPETDLPPLGQRVGGGRDGDEAIGAEGQGSPRPTAPSRRDADIARS